MVALAETRVNLIVDCGKLVSVKEALREISDRGDSLSDWADMHKTLFHIPTADEAIAIQEIFKVSHFQQSLEKKKQLKGGTFADPFLIAKAKVEGSSVITQEKRKPNGTKIPNICDYFGVNCMNLEEFMEKEGWEF